MEHVTKFFDFSQWSSVKTFSLVAVPFLTVNTTVDLFVGLCLLILLDFLASVRTSHILKNIKFRPFSRYYYRQIYSSGLRRSWRKSYEYFIGISAIYVMETYVLKLDEPILMFGKSYSLTQAGFAIACVIELYSIYESMEKVNKKNIIVVLISFLPEKIKSVFDAVLEKSVKGSIQRLEEAKAREDYEYYTKDEIKEFIKSAQSESSQKPRTKKRDPHYEPFDREINE